MPYLQYNIPIIFIRKYFYVFKFSIEIFIWYEKFDVRVFRFTTRQHKISNKMIDGRWIFQKSEVKFVN